MADSKVLYMPGARRVERRRGRGREGEAGGGGGRGGVSLGSRAREDVRPTPGLCGPISSLPHQEDSTQRGQRRNGSD